MTLQPLAYAVSALIAAAPMHAAAQNPDADEIVVTATRRSLNVQEVPFNIAAIDGATLDEREIDDLAELGRNVPGFYVVDQGRRTANMIVVRGLNLGSVRGTEALGNDGGDTVATYVGDIPLYVDLNLADIERVEVLLGPQGTLYGAGTLGGAVRYIPKRPEFSGTSMTLRASSFDLAESDGMGTRTGLTVNAPFAENFAFRATVDYYDDPGFIDTPYLVRNPGVSDPEPDFSDPAAVAANLYSVEDANDEQMVYSRVGLRWQPTDGLDANLTYYYQHSDVGGRSDNHVHSFGTDRYASGARYPEPNERENRLAALELTADLGFAELTSATGYSTFSEVGQRDQTDLLITLDFGYEQFPSFSAFTRDEIYDRTWSQELRFVSKGDGPWSWLGGAFFMNTTTSRPSREFTPHFDEYLVGFTPPAPRPDALEYYKVFDAELTERGVFGEVAYDVTDRWQVSVGGRLYEYDFATVSGVAFPLLESVYYGLPSDEIDMVLEENGQKHDGTLYKLNTSYRFSDDMMGYVTISEGFRYGASNGIPPCPDPLPAQPMGCALPHEVQYFPDTTTNYEVGLRSRWFDRRLTVNASVYHIDWDDPQLFSQTAFDAVPITVNGRGAESDGLEVSFNAALTQRLGLGVSYAYTDAELTAVAPGLLQVFEAPGFGPSPAVYVDGQPGDRLPGSPKQQGTVSFDYAFQMAGGWDFDFHYGLAAVGDMLAKTGGRVGSETFGGYTVHSAALSFSRDALHFGVYAQNLTNKYALTGLRTQPQYVQTVADENGDPVRVRSYSHSVLRPREIGFKISYDLDM